MSKIFNLAKEIKNLPLWFVISVTVTVMNSPDHPCIHMLMIKLPLLSEDSDVTGSLLLCVQNIESRLKVLLPDDVGAALMDGVVLCHLANHICPRSVASIHVPSPAVVSKLKRIKTAGYISRFKLEQSE